MRWPQSNDISSFWYRPFIATARFGSTAASPTTSQSPKGAEADAPLPEDDGGDVAALIDPANLEGAVGDIFIDLLLS
jgi:hypothetical protein